MGRPGLSDGLALEFQQVGEPQYWAEEAVTVAELLHEQRGAIEATVKYGYYETVAEQEA